MVVHHREVGEGKLRRDGPGHVRFGAETPAYENVADKLTGLLLLLEALGELLVRDDALVEQELPEAFFCHPVNIGHLRLPW